MPNTAELLLELFEIVYVMTDEESRKERWREIEKEIEKR